MKKLLLMSATLALTVASAANTYRVTLFQKTYVNGTELKPGDYKVTLKDNKAVLSSGKTSVEANVKTETADSKYSSTTVRYRNGDGRYSVQEIRLGGTNTKVVFED